MIRSRFGIRFLALLVVAVSVAFLGGCGGGKKTEGKITHKGKAVTGGSLTFSPMSIEGATTATGTVNPDGTFKITTSKGSNPKAGTYKVSYNPPPVELPEGKELKPGQSMPRSPYDGLTPKTPQITVDGSEINIELVPKS
ncbi:MAG: hypothetical protein ACFCD0_24000 [Gemmataceae bacterium]